MKTVRILHYSPLGSLKQIAENLAHPISVHHPELEIKICPLIHSTERKQLLDEGVNCDILFVLVPAYYKRIPEELRNFLAKCSIKATFASVVCAYGRANPVLAIKRIKYYLRKRSIPVVSALDIPVGHVTHESKRLEDLPEVDYSYFMESSLHNADVGKRIRIPLSAGKDKNVRYFV